MEVDNISNSSTSVNSTDEDNDDGRLDLFHDDLDNSSISSIESYCSTLEEEEEEEEEKKTMTMIVIMKVMKKMIIQIQIILLIVIVLTKDKEKIISLIIQQ